MAPARCCLKAIGQPDASDKAAEGCQVPSFEERIVEKAFGFLPELSQILIDKYGL